jgi:hypothetical protein
MGCEYSHRCPREKLKSLPSSDDRTPIATNNKELLSRINITEEQNMWNFLTKLKQELIRIINLIKLGGLGGETCWSN